MSWHEVDMAADPRGGQFAYFRQMVDPFAGVTAAVDITDFLAALDGRPFFLSLQDAVTRAATVCRSCGGGFWTGASWNTTGAARRTRS